MPAAPLAVAVLLSISVALSAVAIGLEPEPFASGASILMIAGGAILTVIAAAGVLLARGRWSRFLTAAIGANWLVVGLVLEAGWGLVVTIAGAVLMAAAIGPWLPRWLRHLPSADGPPRAAVLMLLALLSTPVALSWASLAGAEAASWLWAGWTLLLAFAIARALPGALTAARFAHPALAVPAAVSLGTAAGGIVAVQAVVVSALAWRRDVGRALAPANTGPNVVRMPPELTPPDVLDAAGLDDSGRPRNL